MVRYALFRGDQVVGRVAHQSIKSAIKERDEWNKQFKEFNEIIKNMPDKKPISFVEVKEYRKKRQTTEQKLRSCFE